jgi:hypothetical protein
MDDKHVPREVILQLQIAIILTIIRFFCSTILMSHSTDINQWSELFHFLLFEKGKQEKG